MSGSTRFFDKSFLVIAHRGASNEAPENTFAAFEKAVGMKADMIELDVQLSADGIPVVFHDEWLEDHTDGSGRIMDLNLESIKKLDAGSWFSSEFSGERIPSLEEVLIWAKQRILLNIEIKSESVRREPAGGVEEKVIRLVVKHEMQKQVLISSFSYKALDRINRADHGIVTSVLYNRTFSRKKSPADLVRELGAAGFHCGRKQIRDRWAQQLLAENIPFLVYTVNDEREMNELIRKGASGIFSDKPDLLRKAADRNRNK